MSRAKNDKGLTLIELVVVMAIVSILVVAMGAQVSDWRQCYKIEAQAQDIYTNMIDSRRQAMDRHTLQFVEIINAPVPDSNPRREEPRRVLVYEDADGNGVQGAGDALFVNALSDYGITHGRSSFAFNPRGLIVNSGGTVASNFSLRLVDSEDEDFEERDCDVDCVVFEATRVRTGEWNGDNCEAK